MVSRFDFFFQTRDDFAIKYIQVDLLQYLETFFSKLGGSKMFILTFYMQLPNAVRNWFLKRSRPTQFDASVKVELWLRYCKKMTSLRQTFSKWHHHSTNGGNDTNFDLLLFLATRHDKIQWRKFETSLRRKWPKSFEIVSLLRDLLQFPHYFWVYNFLSNFCWKNRQRRKKRQELKSKAY